MDARIFLKKLLHRYEHEEHVAEKISRDFKIDSGRASNALRIVNPSLAPGYEIDPKWTFIGLLEHFLYRDDVLGLASTSHVAKWFAKYAMEYAKYLYKGCKCGYPLPASISTGICGATTFGHGRIDDYGYWEIPCLPTAKEWSSVDPDEPIWPSE